MTIFHEKTSLTARRSRTIVAERKSNIVRRNLDPNFHFSMASEIDVDDKKVRKSQPILLLITCSRHQGLKNIRILQFFVVYKVLFFSCVLFMSYSTLDEVSKLVPNLEYLFSFNFQLKKNQIENNTNHIY